jgi:hypothetical protein
MRDGVGLLQLPPMIGAVNASVPDGRKRVRSRNVETGMEWVWLALQL